MASSTTSRGTSVTNPVEEASSAGVSACSFLKLGDGRWSGVVYAADGSQLDLEEMATQWRCVTDGTTAKTLKQLLEKLVKEHG